MPVWLSVDRTPGSAGHEGQLAARLQRLGDDDDDDDNNNNNNNSSSKSGKNINVNTDKNQNNSHSKVGSTSRAVVGGDRSGSPHDSSDTATATATDMDSSEGSGAGDVSVQAMRAAQETIVAAVVDTVLHNVVRDTRRLVRTKRRNARALARADRRVAKVLARRERRERALAAKAAKLAARITRGERDAHASSSEDAAESSRSSAGSASLSSSSKSLSSSSSSSSSSVAAAAIAEGLARGRSGDGSGDAKAKKAALRRLQRRRARGRTVDAATSTTGTSTTGTTGDDRAHSPVSQRREAELLSELIIRPGSVPSTGDPLVDAILQRHAWETEIVAKIRERDGIRQRSGGNNAVSVAAATAAAAAAAAAGESRPSQTGTFSNAGAAGFLYTAGGGSRGRRSGRNGGDSGTGTADVDDDGASIDDDSVHNAAAAALPAPRLAFEAVEDLDATAARAVVVHETSTISMATPVRGPRGSSTRRRAQRGASALQRKHHRPQLVMQALEPISIEPDSSVTTMSAAVEDAEDQLLSRAVIGGVRRDESRTLLRGDTRQRLEDLDRAIARAEASAVAIEAVDREFPCTVEDVEQQFAPATRRAWFKPGFGCICFVVVFFFFVFFLWIFDNFVILAFVLFLSPPLSRACSPALAPARPFAAAAGAAR
jgi:hypothetical protein